MQYSKFKNAFYHESLVYADLPTDLVDITTEQHQFLMSELSDGKSLSSDENGYPVAIDIDIALAEKTIEQKRANMTISPAQARLNLNKAGLRIAVETAIGALPIDHDLRTKWEHSDVLHRLDPMLNEFCVKALNLSPEQIDALFTS